MEDYLREILKCLPEVLNGTYTTPTADHLFEVQDNAPKLNKERAEVFHCVMAQLLFIVQCGRPDLRTAVSFLTKRVQAPDEDEYEKLA